jgi:hypothetical protein
MASAISPSPVPFVLKRAGGAIIVADMSIWAGVGTPQEKRVDILTFTQAVLAEEKIDHPLPPGVYQCVLRVIVREDLRGDYEFRMLVNGDQVAFDKGDVDTDPNVPSQGIAVTTPFALKVI